MPERFDPEPAVAVGPPPDNLRLIRNGVLFIAVVAAGFVIKALQEVVTPLVVAVFMLLLIDAFQVGLARRWPRVPEWLGLSAAVAMITAGFVFVVGVCVHYGKPFALEIAGLEPRLNLMLGQISAGLHLPSLGLPDLSRGDTPSEVLLRVFGAARGIVSRAILVVIYLGFLLASRRAFGLKSARLFSEPDKLAQWHRLFQRVRTATDQYMALQTLKAAMIAVLTGVIAAVLGLQHAPFWAFLLFLVAYIPIVGGIVGAVLPALVALAEFESPLRPLAILLLLGGGIFVIDNLIMPKIQADRLNIAPVFVLLSLGFWGTLFGLPGVFLSTPLTVMVIAVTAEIHGLRWLAVVLSKEGELPDEL